jgi:DNA/RNA-binding domain of Phe-tRNA-synthetase-like protein
VASVTIAASGGRSPRALKLRLEEISDRISGIQAVGVREKPIPHAYRVFYRHLGLDPDVHRTPIEQIMFERIFDGGLRSGNRVQDALTIAIAEVGVAVQAFDADKVEGAIGLRMSEEGEEFEGRVTALSPGTIVLADDERALAVLFGRTAKGREPTRKTKRVTIVAIGVKGVPDIALDESLWVATSAFQA